MKKALKDYLKSMAVKLPIYAVFVTVYIVVVLKFLRKPLLGWFTSDRELYAVLALGLIVGQGFVLELTTRFVDHIPRKKSGP
jgi:hypothetical protein